ncbi:hypothetical protein ACWGB8_29920 [Kitasatospora sp. NPDC054939]
MRCCAPCCCGTGWWRRRRWPGGSPPPSCSRARCTATDVIRDPEFAKAVSVVSAHYPCEGGNGGGGTGGEAYSCPVDADARNSGKPLWAGENGSQDLFSGAAPLIRTFTRGYIDGRLTAHLNWPVVAAIYPNQPYNTAGLVLANQPASGTYTVGKNTWATAQITQFTSPGWKFLDKGSGYLGGVESNGTFVTLKSPTGSDYSTVIETTTATVEQTVRLNVSNACPPAPSACGPPTSTTPTPPPTSNARRTSSPSTAPTP